MAPTQRKHLPPDRRVVNAHEIVLVVIEVVIVFREMLEVDRVAPEDSQQP
jgi:hypothetical protein